MSDASCVESQVWLWGPGGVQSDALPGWVGQICLCLQRNSVCHFIPGDKCGSWQEVAVWGQSLGSGTSTPVVMTHGNLAYPRSTAPKPPPVPDKTSCLDHLHPESNKGSGKRQVGFSGAAAPAHHSGVSWVFLCSSCHLGLDIQAHHAGALGTKQTRASPP